MARNALSQLPRIVKSGKISHPFSGFGHGDFHILFQHGDLGHGDAAEFGVGAKDSCGKNTGSASFCDWSLAEWNDVGP